MTLVFNINASDPASALARSVTVNSPAQKPVFVLGDNPLIQLYISDGAGAYDASSGAAGYVPWLGIGTPGALPSGGTFYLGVSSTTSGTLTNGKRYLISTYIAGDDFSNVGGTNVTGSVFNATGTIPTIWSNASVLVEITSDISCPPTAAAIQTALNNTHAIGANGVTVTASSSASLAFVFDFTAVGTRYLTAGYGAGMTPDSSAIVAQLIAGSSTVKERQFLRLVANPAALQTTWTAITNGWQAYLSCATRGLVDLLNGAASQSSRLELQLVDGSGNITTVGQVECVIRNEVVDPAALIPVPLPSYLTAAESRLAFLQNRYAVTGLTGGGTNLDGIATGTTANPTVATSSFVAIVVSGVAYLYQLVTGTDATSSPEIIRPTDYDGSTNARVWKLRDTRIAAHHTTHENGGSDEINVAGLSGLLADAQTPLAHATSHKSGGSDAIKLDELAAPTDVTTLNASTSYHGLLPKLDGSTSHVLLGNGTWAPPPSPLQLYKENPSSPIAPSASGSNAVAIGDNAQATTNDARAFAKNSTASGAAALALMQGSTASGAQSIAAGYGCTSSAERAVTFGIRASGHNVGVIHFSSLDPAYTLGISQLETGTYFAETTNGTPANLTGYPAATFLLQAKTTICFRVLIAARRSSSSENDAWEISGMAHRDATAGSMVIDAIEKNHIGSTAWDFNITADTTNGGLNLVATGEAAKTIRWTAAIQASCVTEG